MKTRYFILATLAMALLAVSCQKTAVGGAQEPEEAPVPVQLTTNLKVNSVSVTKAAVDAWAGQKLYIYALPTNKIPASGESEEVGKILVENAEASAPAAAVQSDENKYSPQDIELYKDATVTPKTYYYYPANKETYDFYGYYVGTAYKPSDSDTSERPNPEIMVNEKISLPLFLDGSQDIMLAKADKEEDTAGMGIAPTNAYGAYSARKHVVPNLKFEHQLSRFVFRVVAGNDLGKKVKITRVELKSNSKATLVIASKNESENPRGIIDASEPKSFELKGTEGRQIPCFPENEITEETSYTFDDDDRIGESIMVIPDSQNGHEMVITMQQYDTDGITPLGEQFTITKTLLPEDVVGTTTYNEFLPGYQYNVNIVVYGRQQVDVKVTLSKWNEAGNIIIDDDKEWEDNEPKLGLKATNQTSQAVCYLYFYDNPIAKQVDETPGTEVRVWDPAQNEMVPAEEGTYHFAASFNNGGSTLYGVTLTKDNTTNKTTVTALIITDPNTPTT